MNKPNCLYQTGLIGSFGNDYSFKRKAGPKLDSRQLEICYAMARIFGSPYDEVLKEHIDGYSALHYGQTGPNYAVVNGVGIPWPFTAENVLPVERIKLPGDCVQIGELYGRKLGEDNREAAELAYILANRAMLKGEDSCWKMFADDCRHLMELCVFETYEDCVPIHGPIAYGILMPNWFHPGTALPRLGLSQ